MTQSSSRLDDIHMNARMNCCSLLTNPWIDSSCPVGLRKSGTTSLGLKVYIKCNFHFNLCYFNSKVMVKTTIHNLYYLERAIHIKACLHHFLTGVAGCQVAHVNVEANKQSLKNHILKNVSTNSDVQYTESEVVLRKAYGIGGTENDMLRVIKCSIISTIRNWMQSGD